MKSAILLDENLACTSALKMKAVTFSATSVNLCQTTWRHFPQDITFHKSGEFPTQQHIRSLRNLRKRYKDKEFQFCYGTRSRCADHSGRAVFAPSNTGIVGSNPTQGMDVCLRLICVCVVLCR
jgi:hypothetical protein